MPDVVKQMRELPVLGPFGKVQSGGVWNPQHFENYQELEPQDRHAVDAVWSGRSPAALLLLKDGLHFFEHRPAENDTSRPYGYTLRTLPLESSSAISKQADSPKRKSFRLIRYVGVFLFGVGTMPIVSYWNSPRISPSIVTTQELIQTKSELVSSHRALDETRQELRMAQDELKKDKAKIESITSSLREITDKSSKLLESVTK